MSANPRDMRPSAFYMNETTRQAVIAEGQRLIAERRANRNHPAQALPGEPVTVVQDGFTVIRPRKDFARFDADPAEVSAFMIDDAMRGAK